MKNQMLLILIAGVCLSSVVSAAPQNEKLVGVDQTKVDIWNQFSADVTKLHKKLISARSVRKETKRGGYHGEFFSKPDFFVEESFYRVDSNQLISRIKWEKDKPESIHVVEVNIFDKKGRVSRDYLVAFLPWGRNAPIQALVNLHSYNKGLHSFRQFDASGERVYEQCSGTSGKESVDISLEYHEIASPQTDTKIYKKCFSGTPVLAGKYLKPH